MRLLLDQGLPRGACEVLERGGHDVIHVADAGLSTADDEAVLDRALAENRTVVTLDADFHAISARRGAIREWARNAVETPEANIERDRETMSGCRQDSLAPWHVLADVQRQRLALRRGAHAQIDHRATRGWLAEHPRLGFAGRGPLA